MVLHNMGLGRIVASFPYIVYVVANMPLLNLMKGNVVLKKISILDVWSKYQILEQVDMSYRYDMYVDHN